jgi:hypothetical protein
VKDQVFGILCGDLLSVLDIDIGDNHLGALLTEAPRYGRPEARASSYAWLTRLHGIALLLWESKEYLLQWQPCPEDGHRLELWSF